MAAPSIPTIPLRTSSIPIVGLGVYQSNPGEETYAAVRTALELGYRHVDTAAVYRNEEDVGRAIRDSGIPREEIFVTTKFFPSAHGFEEAQQAFRRSLSLLGLNYVDLYLIHSPGAADSKGRAESWRGMEKAVTDGLARNIGVSNFGVPHLTELLKTATIVPAVNQVELSPYRNLFEIADFCKSHGIALEAYSPLTKGQRFNDPRLVAMAAKYNKSPAQILIRYGIDNGWVVLPKSVNRDRIRDNLNVFDFQLTPSDLVEMRGWEENLTTGWDPTARP